MTAAPTNATTIEGDVATVISGGEFHGPFVQNTTNVLHESLRAKVLDLESVRRITATYVRAPHTEAASSALRAHGAVALLGEFGSGRRTTGVALLAEIAPELHPVVLDEESFRRTLALERGHGYLLDLETSRDEIRRPGTAEWVSDLAARARRLEAPLVVRARVPDWAGLGIESAAVPAFTVTSPHPLGILRGHLGFLADEHTAQAWARVDQVVETLAGAAPADAVRMAWIIDQVRRSGIAEDEQRDQILMAYANWTDQLIGWFRDHDDGFPRALLLAIAALEGAPPATVFAAAERLTKLVDLPAQAGSPLTGPDLETLIDSAQGTLAGDRVRFSRPSYAVSVLDHVWWRRPHMRETLGVWLAGLPETRDEHTERAAQSLTDLTVRHREASLLCRAAAGWAERAGTRPLAIGALTTGAISDGIGREVRLRLYDWSRSGAVSEGLHLTVARVCAGPLAEVYPQIALTRLRHLSIRRPEGVQAAAFEALAVLARNRRLRGAVLTELTDWLAGDDPRRSKARPAFLRIAAVDDASGAGGIGLLSDPSPSDLDRVVALWRAALRDPGDFASASAVVGSWLEEAVQGRAPRELVTEVFARTSRSRIDLGNLADAVLTWMSSDQPAPMSRRALAKELLVRAQLVVGATTVPREEA